MQVGIRYIEFDGEYIAIVNIDGNDFLTSLDYVKIVGSNRTNLSRTMLLGLTFMYSIGGNKKLDYVMTKIKPKARHMRLIDLNVRHTILTSLRVKTKFSLFIMKYEETSGINTNRIEISEFGETKFGYVLMDYFRELGYDIERQKTINVGDKIYRLDFYVPKLSLCIEYDEDHHTHQYNNSRDLDVSSLGIHTIRVKEKWPLGRSIATVSKYLLSV